MTREELKRILDKIETASRVKLASVNAANVQIQTFTQELQDDLARLFINLSGANMEFVDGKIVFSPGNITELTKIIQSLSIEYQGGVDVLIEGVIQSINDITNKADDYFKVQKVPNYTVRAKNELRKKLGITPDGLSKGGYMDSILRSSVPLEAIKAEALKGISRGLSQKEFMAGMMSQITGSPIGKSSKGESLGIIEQHHRATEMSDFFDRYERTYSNNVAKEVGLDQARYSGGLMGTSRDFCVQRQGKIFTRKDIVGWASLSFRGKNAAYNPFTDLGGYNCRHTLDWVSDELAKEMRDSSPPEPDVTVTSLSEDYPEDTKSIGYKGQVFSKGNWEFLKSENKAFPIDILIDIHNTKGVKFDMTKLDRFPTLKKGLFEWTSSSNSLREPTVSLDTDLMRARKVFQALTESLRVDEKTVWRGNVIKINGQAMPSSQVYDELKNWKKGSKIKFGETSKWGSDTYDMTLLSSSVVETKAFDFYENIMTCIKNKKGVRGFNISSVSGYEEFEVVFGDNFEYEILDALNVNGRSYLVLDQLD